MVPVIREDSVTLFQMVYHQVLVLVVSEYVALVRNAHYGFWQVAYFNFVAVVITCGNSTYSNNTYFVNPNFPNSYAGGSSCSITIKKCNPDICQVGNKQSL